MKKIIFTLLTALIACTISAQEYSKDEFESIEIFLKNFKNTASSKDKQALLSLIYPLEIENKFIAEEIAKKAILGDENHNSDFSYSQKAMTVLIENHLQKFAPLSEDLKTILMKNDEFIKVIKDSPNEEIAVFNFKNSLIILILDAEKPQLLFWKNLNNLIK